MFSCEKGKGVYLNGEKVSVSNKKNLINSTIVVSRSELKRGEWEPFKKQFKSIKPIGSVAYKLALVSAGDMTFLQPSLLKMNGIFVQVIA